jgi:hypothetical protein
VTFLVPDSETLGNCLDLAASASRAAKIFAVETGKILLQVSGEHDDDLEKQILEVSPLIERFVP